MNNIILRLKLLLTMIMVCVLNMNAVVDDGNVYSKTSSTTVAVVYSSNNDVVIPDSVELNGIKYSVTSIASAAFRERKGLTSIRIGKNINKIGEWAFEGCNLQSVEISDLEAWCNIDFGTRINKIPMDSHTTKERKKIHTYMNSFECHSNPLMYSKNLIVDGKVVTDLVLPDNIKRIKDCAFVGCTGLTSIKLPKNLEAIGQRAFWGCNNLRSIRFGDKISSIGSCAFKDCEKLEAVHLSSVAAWCGVSFGTFPNAGKMVDSHYSNSKTDLDYSSNPLRLTQNLYLNDNILSELIIPENVKTINEGTFYCITSITSITFLGATPPQASSKSFPSIDYWNVALYIPLGSRTAYSKHGFWGKFNWIIETDTQTELPEGDIDGESNVDSVLIEEIEKFIMGNPSSNFNVADADVNEDGVVNVADIVSIIGKADNNDMSGKWVMITDGFDKTIPFTKIRVLNKKAVKDAYRCIAFSTSPNKNVGVDSFFINFGTQTIGDNKPISESYGKPISSCTPIGDNWYEYEFSCPVYFAYYQDNCPRGQVKALIQGSFNAESDNYLTFVALESGAFKFSKKINYSLDNGTTWHSLASGVASPMVNAGKKIMWKATLTPGSSSSIGTFSSTSQFTVEGNAMSLLYGDNFFGQTSLKGMSYAFCGLFENCKKLINAESMLLPATTLEKYCYDNMFKGCTALTTAPKLPATTLAYECYYSMFEGCTSLTTAPKLPATTLADYCYCYMFNGCTSLTAAPELSATSLKNDCYRSMFKGCTSLTKAPELPAEKLTRSCYEEMFNGCTSLTVVPELLATTLELGCYRSMFKGCTSLTKAPELPAEKLKSSCYEGMFNGCTSLTKAPELPATSLSYFCYRYMFNGCTSLTAAPELPATTLVSGCYKGMFHDCTSLTAAPELPAATLVESCYEEMFRFCSSLKYIKCMATNIRATDCTTGWVCGVASSGTFILASNTSWKAGNDGIPFGWSVYDAESGTTIRDNYDENDSDTSGKYLTFVALEDGYFSFKTNSTPISYSLDGGNTWSTLDSDMNSPMVGAGQRIIWKGNLTPSTGIVDYGVGKFCSTGQFNIRGNVMSLLYSDNFIEQTSLKDKSYAFYGLFENCKKLINAESMILPATTLAEDCYGAMFFGCTSLIAAPKLPATTLAEYCYSSMFHDCTSLTAAPELPATTLAKSCYLGMFRYCYSLRKAPELSAARLVSYCYAYMFEGCGYLNYIKCLATSISPTGCTNGWVDLVAKNGTFVKSSGMESWTRGESGIPSGWTVKNE